MRVLFIHDNNPDYLSAGLFHGLRSLLGIECVDFPRFDCMYKDCSAGIKSKIRGNGFTLYGLLDDIPELQEKRFFLWEKELENFDYFIVTDIWNNWEKYLKLTRLVDRNKIVVIDCADTNRVFPFANLKKSFSLILTVLLTSFKGVRFYKRELPDCDAELFGLPKIFAKILRKLFYPSQIKTLAFSIPAEKINKVSLSDKVQHFNLINVDGELLSVLTKSHLISLSSNSYLFTIEDEYYDDLKRSKFGVTTKRAGWDCLRHYEYAANGCVLCFRDLNSKPVNSAPLGLSENNCIVYSNSSELLDKISQMSNQDYEGLLRNSYLWIENNTTIARAKELLEQLGYGK